MATLGDVQRRRKVLVDKVIGDSSWNSYFLVVAVIGVLTGVFDGYDSAVFGVATPLLNEAFDATPAQIGVLASWGMVGMFVGSFLSGILADMLGRKRALILMTVVFCLFTGLCGFSRSFAMFAVFRFIAGIGLPGLGPAAGGMMSEYVPTKQRFSTIPFLSWGMMVGQILVSLMGIVVARKFGWSVLFFTSFLLMLIIVLQIWLLPESMHVLIQKGNRNAIVSILRQCDPTFVPTPEDDYQIAKVGASKMPILMLFSRGFARNTLALFGVLFMNYFMIYGLTNWLPKLMMQVGSSYTLALWFNIIFFLGALFAIPLSSFLASKYDIRVVIRWTYAVCAICIAFLWVKSSVYLTIVLLLLGGGSLQACMGLMSAFVANNYPLAFRSTAMGTIWTVGRVGSILSTILLGYLLSSGIEIQIDFIVVAIPCIVCIVLVSIMNDYTQKGFPEQV